MVSYRVGKMKGTEKFKEAIQQYLVDRVLTDDLFANVITKPNKNVDDCVTYIINQVHKSGCNAFTDEEIFSMAVHYYDEDNVQVGNPIACNVVVAKSPEPVSSNNAKKVAKSTEPVSKKEKKETPVIPIGKNTKFSQSSLF